MENTTCKLQIRRFIFVLMTLVLIFTQSHSAKATRTYRDSNTFSIDTVSSVLLSSSTHPDPNLWYNQNDPIFSWASFVEATGYYFIFDQNPSTKPTGETGQYVLGTQLPPLKDTEDGTWYLHLVAELETGELDSNVASYQINIDTAPPTVTSTTHPNQNDWYQARQAELNWTALHPSSVAKFYYKLDQETDTVPTSSTGTVTQGTNATYSDLSDGTWYFHIVWEDAAGNIGENAAHFKLNIDDTNPPPVTQLEANIQPNGDIALNWSDPGDATSGVIYYQIFRSEQAGMFGRRIEDNCTETTYNDVGAGALGKTFYYTIFPVDKANNKQTQGNVQIQAGYSDQTPPRITSLSPAELFTEQFIRPANRQLSVTVVEENGIAENALTLHVKFISGSASSETPVTMTRTGTGSPWTFSAEIPFSQGSDGQQVELWITGTDLVGNSIESDTTPKLIEDGKWTVTLDGAEPKVTQPIPADQSVYKIGDTPPDKVDIATDESGSGIDLANSSFTITRNGVDFTSSGTLTESNEHLLFTPNDGFLEGKYEMSVLPKDKVGNVGTAATRLNFTIDQTAPRLIALDPNSPGHGGYVPEENADVKVTVEEVGGMASDALTLHYEIYTNLPSGQPTGDLGMSRTNTSSPWGFTATLPLSAFSEGKKVDYWITGSDAVGNPLTSSLTPSLLVTGKATLTIGQPSVTFTNWIQEPADLTEDTTGSFKVKVTISGGSQSGVTVEFDYRIGEGSYDGYEAMTKMTDNTWQFEIAEPGSWSSYSGQTLYYKARYDDGAGMVVESAERSELIDSINGPPGAFSLLSPSDGTTVQTLPPVLDWEDALDPDAGDQVSYTLWYAQSSDFSNPTQIENLSESTYTISAELTDGATYYWKVKAFDKEGAGTLCTQGSWSFTVNLLATLQISLGADWNLFSFPLQLDTDAMPNALSSVEGEYTYVSGFVSGEGAKTWDVNRPTLLNDLKKLDPFHGYWIKTTQATTLILAGTRLAADEPISLGAGWNLISYLPEQTDELSHALSSIAGQYTYVSGFVSGEGAKTWDASRPALLNDLKRLEPNHGYWIKMTQAATLTYPTSGYSPATAPAKRLVYAESIRQMLSVVATPISMDVWGHFESLKVGDVVTAKDSNGVVCGVSYITYPGLYLMHVYGDDSLTSQDEGANEGEVIRIFINDKPAVILGNMPTFEALKSKRLDLLPRQTKQLRPIPVKSKLLQNFPNPFNPETWIPFHLATNAQVEIDIYDAKGRLVKRLYFGQTPAGYYDRRQSAVYWDGRNESGEKVSSGIYFYRLEAGSFVAVRKLLIIR